MQARAVERVIRVERGPHRCKRDDEPRQRERQQRQPFGVSEHGDDTATVRTPMMSTASSALIPSCEQVARPAVAADT